MPREVTTFCRICQPACGLVAEVEQDRVLRLRPDKSHPVTQGFACHKGLQFNDFHHDPDRLDTPIRRCNPRRQSQGRFESVSWDEAMADIAARVTRIRNKCGSDAIGSYVGNPAAFNCTALPLLPAFMRKLGSRSCFNSGTQDMANKLATAEAVFGTESLYPIPDLAHVDYLLSLGANPKVSHMSTVSVPNAIDALRAIGSRGGKVVDVNPRRIESVSPDSELLQIRPDTDLYLLAAVLQEIDALGRFDEEAIARHGRNIDGLRAFVRRFPPERVASITGIEAGVIRRTASEFSASGAAAAYMSTGVNMGRQGALAYWLVQMLNFVTGNLGRRGGSIYPMGFYPSAPLGVQPQKPEHSYFDSPFGEVRHVGGVLPGNLIADYIESGEPALRALIVLSANPLLSVGGGQRLRQALSKLELIVTIDTHLNATSEIADYVLPATDWLERQDVNLVSAGLQPLPYVQYTEAVVPPGGERKEEWWIVARLEQELGLPSALDDGAASPFARIDMALSHSELSIEKLRQLPHNTALLPSTPPEAFFDLGVQTADGKIDCCPPAFDAALDRAEEIFSDLESEPKDQLKLITLRTSHMHNTVLQNSPLLRRGKHRTNPLHMHPKDAAARGLEEGNSVLIHNNFGRVHAEVTLDSSLRRGVVAMTHGYGSTATPALSVASRHPGVNVNELLPSGPGSYDKLSNQAFMSGVPVLVEASKA
jgi:anaerobic selenocysteine-containing dehydrogenase